MGGDTEVLGRHITVGGDETARVSRILNCAKNRSNIFKNTEHAFLTVNSPGHFCVVCAGQWVVYVCSVCEASGSDRCVVKRASKDACRNRHDHVHDRHHHHHHLPAGELPTIFLRHYDEDREKLESPVSVQRLRVRRELGSEVYADPVERAGGRRIGTKSLYLRIS